MKEAGSHLRQTGDPSGQVCLQTDQACGDLSPPFLLNATFDNLYDLVYDHTLI